MADSDERTHGAPPRQCGSSRAGAMVLDAPPEPMLHFRFHPAYGAQTYAHPGRESAFGLELVDHRASEAGDLADLREPKYLDVRCSHGRDRLRIHMCDASVWVEPIQGKLSREARLQLFAAGSRTRFAVKSAIHQFHFPRRAAAG
jgi:hypothetical protein